MKMEITTEGTEHVLKWTVDGIEWKEYRCRVPMQIGTAVRRITDQWELSHGSNWGESK